MSWLNNNKISINLSGIIKEKNPITIFKCKKSIINDEIKYENWGIYIIHPHLRTSKKLSFFAHTLILRTSQICKDLLI